MFDINVWRPVKGGKAWDAWRQYRFIMNRYGCRTLYGVYQKPSEYKKSSWEDIIKKDKVPGTLTVTGYSCHVYTAMYITQKDGKFFLIKETAYNTYKYELEKVEACSTCTNELEKVDT